VLSYTGNQQILSKQLCVICLIETIADIAVKPFSSEHLKVFKTV